MNNKKQRNRLFTMLLLVMAILMPYEGAWAQTPTPSAKGDGKKDSPYIITKAEELAWFRNQVNGGEYSICAKIADNVEVIDLKDFCYAADDSKNIEGKSWEPIGVGNAYTGTFDGSGKTISNLYIKYIKAEKQIAGLFGHTYQSTIKNLTFENANVTNTEYYTGILVGDAGYGSTLQNIKISNTCQMRGVDYTGGIAGSLDGNANNCVNYATVQGTENVGGLFGSYDRAGNSMTACANYGNVTASSQEVGGLVGYFGGGTIQDCANYGNVKGTDRVAGLAGFVYQGKIKNVFSYGSISATNSTQDIGMAFGYSDSGAIEGMVAYYSGAKLTVNSQEKDVKAFGDGNLSEDNATGFTEAQLKSGEVAWLLNGSTSVPTEGSTLVWYQKLGDNADAYPVLKSTGDNTVYQASLISCDGTTHIGEYANNPNGDQLSHNYQMVETPDEGTPNLYGEKCSLCHTVNDGTKYIKDFCGIKDNNIKLTVESDGSYTAAEPVEVNDNAAYNSPVDFTAPTLKYTRSFAHDKWQALYVPFETEVTEELLNDFELAAPNNLHEYELADGSTKVSLEAKLMKSGYTIKALRPYLIRAKEAGEKTIQLTDCPLKGAAEDSYVDCSSVLRHYKFIGTLKGKTSFDTSADFVLQQGLFLGTVTDTQLKPMRWYLNATDRETDMGILPGSGNNGDDGGADGGNGSTQASRSINITIVDGDATTGIDDLHVITEQASGSKNGACPGIYDLQGRKLSQEPQNGVYIKDGKKVIK